MVNLSFGDEYTQLIERLNTLVRDRFDKSHSDKTQAVLDFCGHYYSAAPFHELERKRIEDLYGMTIGLWDFIRNFTGVAPHIRVFNPRYEDHGWQSTHTILEVLTKDCAFLVDTVMMDVVRRGISIHSVINNV